MLTDTELNELKEFLSSPDEYSNIYGAATLPRKSDTDSGGTLIINNKGSKPINYFLCWNTTAFRYEIGGLPYTDFSNVILTKKHLDGSTQTIVLPINKIK